MTGQVKEDILSRLAELGVRIDGGILHFNPVLFESRELLREPAEFVFCDFADQSRTLPLEPGSFAFTVCQTPIVYQRAERTAIVIHRGEQRIVRENSLQLTRDETLSLQARAGEITRIDVLFKPNTSH